jgi:hypothetical protein
MVERTLNGRAFAIIALVVTGCKPPEVDTSTTPFTPAAPISSEAGASGPVGCEFLVKP